MPGDDRLIALEQGGDLVEAQPEALALEPDIQFDYAILPLIQDNLATRIFVLLRHASASGPQGEIIVRIVPARCHVCGDRGRV